VEFYTSVDPLDSKVSTIEKLLAFAKFDHIIGNLIFTTKIGALGISGIVIDYRYLIFLTTGARGIH
jgi:hypothetical protein